MVEWLVAKNKSIMRSGQYEQCGRDRYFQEKEHGTRSPPLWRSGSKPFFVGHTGSELKDLAVYLKRLDGETRIIMEYTGRHYELVARFLHEEGIFVSTVDPKLLKDYWNNTLRKVKQTRRMPGKLPAMGLSPQRGCHVSKRQSRQEPCKQLGRIASAYTHGYDSNAAENAEPVTGSVLQDQDDNET